MSLITRTAVVATVLCGALAVPAHAQASPIFGRWAIEYAVGMRMENDVQTAVMGKATLTIASDADSVIATIDGVTRLDGSTPPPQKIGGKLKDGSVTLVSKRKAKLNMNGDMIDVDISTVWMLKATGDVLSGTMQAKADGPLPEMPATAVTGKRAS